MKNNNNFILQRRYTELNLVEVEPRILYFFRVPLVILIIYQVLEIVDR